MMTQCCCFYNKTVLDLFGICVHNNIIRKQEVYNIIVPKHTCLFKTRPVINTYYLLGCSYCVV